MIDAPLARGAAASALAAALTACGHLPIAPAAYEEMTQKRSGLPADWTVAEMTGDPAAIVADYSVFGDPLLTALVTEALENNRSLRAAAENVRQSEALLRQARSGLWPSLRASLGVSAQTPVDDFDLDETYSFNVSAAYAPDLLGDLSSSIRASAWGLRSTEATYELARRQLALQVARAYFIAIEQQLQLELDRRTLARAQDTFRITEVRFEQGSVARDELVLGESNLASNEDAILASEASVRAATRALEVLLGRFPQNRLNLPATLPEPPAAPPLGLPERTVRARPDVVAAEYNILQTFANTRVARLGRWPQIDATLGLGLTNAATSTDDLFDFDDLAFSVGLQLAQTLFDGGFLSGRVDAAEANQRAALERYGQTVIDAYGDVVDALDQFATLQSRARALATASSAARETLRLGELRYNEGSESLLNLLQVQDRADSAESQLIANRRTRLEQWLVLHQAVGGDPLSAQPLAAAPDEAAGG
jgi:NodT family efflux transporter outer membrane factor (OMF) lipoprotein